MSEVVWEEGVIGAGVDYLPDSGGAAFEHWAFWVVIISLGVGYDYVFYKGGCFGDLKGTGRYAEGLYFL